MNAIEAASITEFIIIAKPATIKDFFIPGTYASDKNCWKSEAYYDTDKKLFFTASVSVESARALQYAKNPKKIWCTVESNQWKQIKRGIRIANSSYRKLNKFYVIYAKELKSGKEFKVELRNLFDYYQDRIYFEDKIPKKPKTVKCYWDFNPWAGNPRPGYGWNYSCNFVDVVRPDGYTLSNLDKNCDWDNRVLEHFNYGSLSKVLEELTNKTGVDFNPKTLEELLKNSNNK